MAMTIKGDGIVTGSTAPAFSAYISTASQTFSSSSFTKILCQAEEFDTANAYDNSTNYRFQPTIPGYYQISGAAYINGSATYGTVSIYKNDVEYKRGTAIVHPTGSAMSATVTSVVYLNGTTDYLELAGYAQGTSLSFAGGNTTLTYFNGYLARSA
jgi:hypothetical protein